MKSPLFEEYLANLDGTRNGKAFKIELGKKRTRGERTLSSQSDMNGALNEQEASDTMSLDAGYSAKERQEPDAPQTVYISHAEYCISHADMTFTGSVWK